MKRLLNFMLLFFVAGVLSGEAQHVRVRVGFPVGMSIGAPGPAPYSGAIWIGPEWRWRGGRYECVRGYWARPHRHGLIWIPGHWKHSRRGYKWIPGHWR